AAADARSGWDRLGQPPGEALIDDAQILDLRQLDIGFDTRRLAFKRRDYADWQPRRGKPAPSRCDQPIAQLKPRNRVEIPQRGTIGVVAHHQCPLARALDDHRDARVEVGDEEDAGCLGADFRDPTDEPLSGYRGLPAHYSILAAGTNHQVAYIGAARIAY